MNSWPRWCCALALMRLFESIHCHKSQQRHVKHQKTSPKKKLSRHHSKSLQLLLNNWCAAAKTGLVMPTAVNKVDTECIAMTLRTRSGGHLQEEPPACSDDFQNKKPGRNDDHSVFVRLWRGRTQRTGLCHHQAGYWPAGTWWRLIETAYINT